MTLGISYQEFEQLDFDEQQNLIKEYHKKQSKYEYGMIGESDHSIFTTSKKGEHVLIGS